MARECRNAINWYLQIHFRGILLIACINGMFSCECILNVVTANVHDRDIFSGSSLASNKIVILYLVVRCRKSAGVEVPRKESIDSCDTLSELPKYERFLKGENPLSMYPGLPWLPIYNNTFVSEQHFNVYNTRQWTRPNIFHYLNKHGKT